MPEHTVMEGSLEKPSTGCSGSALGLPRWQQRHFVLRDDGQLQRFATADTSGIPQAVLHLTEASSVVENGRELRVKLKGGGEVHLRAADDSDAHCWASAIRRQSQNAVSSTASPPTRPPVSTPAGEPAGVSDFAQVPKLPHLLHVPAPSAPPSSVPPRNALHTVEQEPGLRHKHFHAHDHDHKAEQNGARHPGPSSLSQLRELEVLRKKCGEMEMKLLEQQQHMKATSQSHAQALASAQARLAKLADKHAAATANAAAAHKKKDAATAELREQCIVAEEEQLRLQEQYNAAVAAAAKESRRHKDELSAIKTAKADMEAKYSELEKNVEVLYEQRSAVAAAAAEERLERELERLHEQHAAVLKQFEAESAATVQISAAARAAEAHAHTATLQATHTQHEAEMTLLREEHAEALAVLRGEHALLLDTRAAEFAALEAKCMLLEQMADQNQNQLKVGEAEAGTIQAALQARLRAAETEATAARDMATRTAEALKRQLAQRNASLEQMKENCERQARVQTEALMKAQEQMQKQEVASLELVQRNESLEEQLNDARRKLKEAEERHGVDFCAEEAIMIRTRDTDADRCQEKNFGADRTENQVPKQEKAVRDACRAKLSTLISTMQAHSSKSARLCGNGVLHSLYQQLITDSRVTLAERPVQNMTTADLQARCHLVEALLLLPGSQDAGTKVPDEVSNSRVEQAAVKVSSAATLHMSADVLMVRAVTEAAPPRSNWAAAADTLRAATKADSADSGAWFRLGLVLGCTDSGLYAYDEGEAALRSCIKIRPSHAAAHLRLGILLKSIRKLPSDAEKCYRRAIHVDPQLSSAYTALGVLLQTRRKPGPDVVAAEAAYRKSLELDSNSADSVMAYANLGLLLRVAGRFIEAEKCYRQAAKLDPTNAVRHIRLGVLLHEDLDRVDDAEQCLRCALHVQAPFGSDVSAAATHSAARAQAHAALGAVLQNPDRSAGPDCAAAEEAFRSAIELEPMLAARHLDMGRFLFRGKGAATPADIDAAEQCFRRALVLDDGCAAAYASLGELLDSARKDHAAALACFTKALSLEPKMDAADGKRELIAAYKGLAVHLESKGDIPGAEKQLRTAVLAAPEEADAHLRLGTLLLKQASNSKRADEAEYYLNKALELDPSNALAHNNLGLLLKSAKHDIEGAERAYRAAVELDDTCVKAYMNLGLLLKQTKRAAEAEHQFKRAIELDPTNALAHNNYGTSLQERGDIDGAESSFRAAIKVAPNNALAHGNLGLLLETARADMMSAEACYRCAVELEPGDKWAQKKLIRALRMRARTAGCHTPGDDGVHSKVPGKPVPKLEQGGKGHNQNQNKVELQRHAQHKVKAAQMKIN